ncbi:hypothetical protein HOY80DRAFT_287843 [Tuber brumale]|nr:hypothetical protein HOY80DRAFT_287843 [Tuber brumale]
MSTIRILLILFFFFPTLYGRARVQLLWHMEKLTSKVEPTTTTEPKGCSGTDWVGQKFLIPIEPYVSGAFYPYHISPLGYASESNRPKTVLCTVGQPTLAILRESSMCWSRTASTGAVFTRVHIIHHLRTGASLRRDGW